MAFSVSYKPHRFQNTAGTISYVFPTTQLEWDSRQELHAGEQEAAGMDYTFDLLHTRMAPKRPSKETIRWTLVSYSGPTLDATIDEARSKLYQIGQGKLFLRNEAGDERWAWARVLMMPEFQLATSNPRVIPFIVDFRRNSNWYDDTLSTQNEIINGLTESFNVVNPGGAASQNPVITMKGTWSGTLVVHNTTTGYMMRSTRAGTANATWLKFDAGRNTVEYSEDSGVSWVDDYANFLRGTAQAGLMRLGGTFQNGGTNAFSISGFGATPNGTLNFQWYPGFD